MSALNIASIQSLAANTPPVIRESGGSEVGQFCRAWVSFAGNDTPLTINDSFNVASITDNGVGDYTVNFTAAFTSAVTVLAFHSSREAQLWSVGLTNTNIRTRDSAGTLTDSNYATVAAFSN